MNKTKQFGIIAAIAAMISLVPCASAQEYAGAKEGFHLAYDAGAEVVSSYIWRGQYNGALSFQPDLSVGWDSKYTSFRVGTWWSLGASDWKFTKKWKEGGDYNPNTYFIPEFDLYANINILGITAGFTHYYYFGNSNYFSGGEINKVMAAGNTSQTEVSVGYDFKTLLGIPLKVSWNMMVSGADGYLKNPEVITEDEEGNPMDVEDWYIDGTYKRAYSSYIEIAYTHTFEAIGLSLTGTFGFSPWKSMYTDMNWLEVKFDRDGNVVYDSEGKPVIIDNGKSWAINNLAIRIEKEWEIGDKCSLNLFAVGSLNTCNCLKKYTVIDGAGDDKLYKQKLNGCIGLGVWF